MKTQALALFAAFTICMTLFGTQNAFANRAEELVFGTGDAGYLVSGGSLYYDDNYNVFYNPAYVNDYKSWGIMEKPDSLGPSPAVDGGFFTSIMNFKLGVFLNRPETLYVPGGPNPQTIYPSPNLMRPIEAYFGGDMGVKFGVGVSYASAAYPPVGGLNAYSDTDLTLHAGIDMDGLAPFASYRVISNSTIAQASLKDFMIGFRYKFGEWTPYAVYRGASVSSGGVDLSLYQAAGVGIGREARISEGLHLKYSIAGIRVLTSNVPGDSGRTLVPLNMGVEGDLTSWLTLMGGFQFNVMDKSGDATNADTPTARLGAKIRIAKAELDWVVGGAPGGNIDSSNFDFANGFFSDASLTYRW